MVKISLLGIPHDDNSHFLKGAAEAPPLIRSDLHSDSHSMWSETGIDLGIEGTIVDHGDIQFDSASDPWDLIEQNVGRALESGNQPIVAADIVEYNPRCDVSNMTAIVAAKLLKEIAGMMVKTARK